MRRNLMAIVAVALVGSLMWPGLAMAAKGGNGNGNGNRKDASAGELRVPPGQERKVAVEQVDEGVLPDSEEETELTAKEERVAAREAFREQQQARREARAEARVQSREESATGAENAVARIGSNLERMASKMDEGKRKQLPPGLVNVWLKFMTALGNEVTIDDVPGSMPASETVAPDAEQDDAQEEAEDFESEDEVEEPAELEEEPESD